METRKRFFVRALGGREEETNRWSPGIFIAVKLVCVTVRIGTFSNLLKPIECTPQRVNPA